MKILWVTLLALIVSVPAHGEEIRVRTSLELQPALNRAAPGDHVVLATGSRMVGSFTLPPKLGMVTLRSETILPARRVTPADAPALARIDSGSSSPALSGIGTSNWTIQGIILDPTLYNVIHLERATNVIVDQVLYEQPSLRTQQRFMLGNGRNITLRRSHIANLFVPGTDSQCFAAWNGAGPYTITDNYLECASENILFGGADSASDADMPCDITVTKNIVTKNLAWKGQSRQVKNLLELKAACRTVIRDNVFDHSWPDAQEGWAILFTVRNQDGKAPWSRLEDVLFEKNTITNVHQGIRLTGYDDTNQSRQTTGVVIRDNQITTQSRAFLITGQVKDAAIYRNTITMPAATAGDNVVLSLDHGPRWVNGEKQMSTVAVEAFTWAANIAPGTYIHSPTASGTAALKAYSTTYSTTEPAPTPDPVPDPIPVPPLPPDPPVPTPVVDTEPPTITTFSVTRSHGVTYRATVNADDNTLVHQVFFYVNDEWAGGTTTNSTGNYYTAYIKIAGKGVFNVRAVVWDPTGNKVEKTTQVKR